jgi:chromosome segregation ATPase
LLIVDLIAIFDRFDNQDHMFNSKKIKILLEENKELKTKFEGIHGKEESINNLNDTLSKLRNEIARLNKVRGGLKESINAIRVEEGNKKQEIEGLNKRIGHLHEMKDGLQNEILSYTSQIDNIESIIRSNNKVLSVREPEEPEFAELEHSNSKLVEKKAEINQCITDAQNKNNKLIEEEAELSKKGASIAIDVKQLEEKLADLQKSYSDIAAKVEKGNELIDALKLEEEHLRRKLENKQGEISTAEKELIRLKEEEKALLDTIGTKIYKVKEIDSELSEKTEIKNILDQEHIKLIDEINAKQNTLIQAQAEYKKFFEDIKLRKKEIFDTQQSLSIKAQRLSNINIELMDYEKKYGTLKNEISELEHFRSELLKNIQKEKETSEKFADQNRKLTELVPLLEKRKLEIEQGNAELEGRFTIMFQKFSNELNQINQKRSVLEQIVLKKEKDVDEKDQNLFEKIAALEESERVLNMRQVEVESLEKQIEQLKEHKDIFRNDLYKMEQEALERKNYTTDIRLETELLLNKKVIIEKSLQELMTYMNESYESAKGRNSKFENELSYYENQIQEYRTRIADSLNELDNLKASIGSLKIEQEEYRGNISRLSSLKKKLHEEITKHQTILQRYQKIREKFKIEQTAGKSFDEIAPKGKSGYTKETKNLSVYKV